MQYSPISHTPVVLLSHIISWVEQKGGFSVIRSVSCSNYLFVINT